MRDDAKTKANNVKTKSAKPTKLQKLRSEGIESAREKLKREEAERDAANRAFRAQVLQADIESGNAIEAQEDDGAWMVDGVDPKSKEAVEARREEARMKRAAKKKT